MYNTEKYLPISHLKSESMGIARSMVRSENAVGGDFVDINMNKATALL